MHSSLTSCSCFHGADKQVYFDNVRRYGFNAIDGYGFNYVQGCRFTNLDPITTVESCGDRTIWLKRSKPRCSQKTRSFKEKHSVILAGQFNQVCDSA